MPFLDADTPKVSALYANARSFPLPDTASRANTKGPLTRAFLEVLEALLWGFHNSRSGCCFPSYEAIAGPRR